MHKKSIYYIIFYIIEQQYDAIGPYRATADVPW